MIERKAVWLSVIVEVNDDGYLASVPGIQGAFAEGETIEEALFNCVDVVKMIADYRTERGEPFDVSSVDLTEQTKLAVSLPIGVS